MTNQESKKGEPSVHPVKNVEHGLDDWSNNRASLEEVRSLAADLGNQHFEAGIPAAIQLLDHQDEIVRYNAAMSLAYEFHYAPAVEKLLMMLTQDPDEDCRMVAAGGLGSLCQNSKDRRVLQVLGKTALNDPDEDVRNSAYQAMLIVNRVSREEHLRLLTSRKGQQVDQAKVKAILSEVSR
jgi:HEAT repeat protein